MLVSESAAAHACWKRAHASRHTYVYTITETFVHLCIQTILPFRSELDIFLCLFPPRGRGAAASLSDAPEQLDYDLLGVPVCL